LYANVAHGLITGLLFLVVGAVKDRHHTTDLALLAPGLRDRLPRLGWLLAFGALAGLGLPGLAGFWGELLAIAGAWRADSALGVISRPLAVLAAIGTVVAAVYLLRVLRELWHGAAPPAAPADPDELVLTPFIGDATAHEIAVTAPLVVATVALGLVPALLLGVTGPAVRLLLAGAP
jgi:NADH-quinone oxidoreductase subunit M